MRYRNLKMRTVLVITCIAILTTAGCELFEVNKTPVGTNGSVIDSPSEVHIIGLTEIVTAAGNNDKVDVYLDLSDDSGSKIKALANFRFELYEHVSRTAQRKGKRIHAWPDIDLTDYAENNAYWKEHLNAYFFELPVDFTILSGSTYLLQVTVFTEDGRRLAGIIDLRND